MSEPVVLCCNGYIVSYVWRRDVSYEPCSQSGLISSLWQNEPKVHRFMDIQRGLS